MARPSWNLFGRLVRRLPPADADRVPDGELLTRFAKDRDQAAFELLVWRHGGLVLGVCRRILRDEQLAEDAFQATFLVLARKAASLDGRNLPGWLHKVARRAAARSAKLRAKRLARETKLTDHAVHSLSPEPDLKGLLDAEVGRLPDRFRQPVLLCYLQNYTTDEAARALGVPQGTILSRLSTARKRLAARLTKRGITLPATLVATTAASDQLVSAVVRSAAAFALGEAVLTSAPTLLATEVIRMSAWKLPTAVAAAMVLTVSVGSGVAWVQGGRSNETVQTVEGKQATPKQEAPKPPAVERNAANDTKRERRENLRVFLEGVTEDYEKLRLRYAEKQRQMREISLEEFQAIQQRYSDTGRQTSQLRRELLEVKHGLSEGEAAVKALQEQHDRELASGNDVRLDLNTRDGLRLQAYYRQQIEADTKIKELVSNGLERDHPTVKPIVKLSDGLGKDIEELESRIRTAEAKTKFEMGKQALEAKSREDEKRRKFLEATLKQYEFNMNNDLKLGIQFGTLASEAELIKDNIAKLDRTIKARRDELYRLDGGDMGLLNPRDRTDEILEELVSLRKELAEVKRSIRK